MIVAAAFCPHPPVLVPDIAQGAAPELDDLRAACADAITSLSRRGRQIVLVGSGLRKRAHGPDARGTLAGYGVPLTVALGESRSRRSPELPLSLTVGAWLVERTLGPDTGAVGIEVGPDGDPPALETDEPTALLVLGDASARRSTAAPGYFDARAERFDADVAAALGSGRPDRLAAIESGLGAALLAAGVPAWHAASRLLSGPGFDAEVCYDAAPYGVGYVVASWTARE